MFSVSEFLSVRKPKNGRFFTITIDGRGCSGKTMLLEYLRALHNDFTCLHGDDYFRHIDDEVAWGAFDEARFLSDVVRPLQTGNTFIHSVYNYQIMQWMSPRQEEVKGVFCLERIYSFRIPLDWDLKLWVETPKDTCARRGIARDAHHMPKERAVMAWDAWQRAEDRYIAQYQPLHNADEVIYGMTDLSSQIT